MNINSRSVTEATGLTHPAFNAVIKMLRYSLGQLLLISNPARGATTIPSMIVKFKSSDLTFVRSNVHTVSIQHYSYVVKLF
jgi:hypothetical protein